MPDISPNQVITALESADFGQARDLARQIANAGGIRQRELYAALTTWVQSAPDLSSDGEPLRQYRRGLMFSAFGSLADLDGLWSIPGLQIAVRLHGHDILFGWLAEARSSRW